MPWSDLIDILTAETDAETAQRIAARIRADLVGQRFTVPQAPAPAEVKLTMAAVRYNTTKAARQLGVARSTIYRKLRRPVR